MKYSIHKFKSFFVMFLSFLIFVSISKSQSEEVIYVSSNGDVDTFVQELDQEGLFDNSFSKIILQAIITLRGGIEPGGYNISRGLGAVSTAFLLEEPSYKYVSIIEGYRKGQIAEILGSKLNWESEKVSDFSKLEPMCPLKGQEGYLAFGTYLIGVDEETHVVEEKMQENFNEILEEIGIDGKDVNIPQIITIASLIQREAGGKSDMRLISGIIQNRLEIGMPLQIDATLQYAKGDETNWWPVPKSEDKKIDSLFNTYQNIGLPPTPIATPGKEAIKAALNPLNTNCLFYLHDSRRNIHCSATYEQHKKNVRYYLK